MQKKLKFRMNIVFRRIPVVQEERKGFQRLHDCSGTVCGWSCCRLAIEYGQVFDDMQRLINLFDLESCKQVEECVSFAKVVVNYAAVSKQNQANRRKV
jgi:hypothetical protein